eukprot:CAMPEP_0194133812 /NCGR_PEP_ID=MMETSP0152-20130528/3822_1 /TAXON_ID=1049557 /ORGANISM="Thalassiothrix antarctica, Strain L6-D1" /LENGTH=443 /DNA_ID=CAMNT_0038829173 /DNA_START=199 /DNA_END=1530 /DNA_ORIENTATION=-
MNNFQSEILGSTGSDCSGVGPVGLTPIPYLYVHDIYRNYYDVTINIGWDAADGVNLFCLKTKMMDVDGNIMIYRAQVLGITIDKTAGFTLTDIAVSNTPLPPNLQAKSDKRCGGTEVDARSNCKPVCEDDDECTDSFCLATSSNYCHIMPEDRPHPECQPEENIQEEHTNSTKRCGFDEMAASDFCGDDCATDDDCRSAGERCQPVLSNLCECFAAQDERRIDERRSLLAKQYDRRDLVGTLSNNAYFSLAKQPLKKHFVIQTIELGEVSGFEVDAFICDKDKVKPATPPPLRIEDGLYVCIKSMTDGLVVKDITEFSLTNDYTDDANVEHSNSYMPIEDGEEDFNTYIQDRGSKTALVGTRVQASFFTNDGTITIIGTAILGPSDNGRYLSRFTQEIDDGVVTTGNFKLDVKVIKVASAASIGTLNTFFSTIMGIAVAFIFF